MLSDPDPLPGNAKLWDFTPDATGAWYVAYAGPCGDDDCTKVHRRLYLIPMIGWQSFGIPISAEQIERIIRPAVMNSSGRVEDFMRFNAAFRFIAVLRGDPHIATVAKEIYRKRYGDSDLEYESAPGAVAN